MATIDFKHLPLSSANETKINIDALYKIAPSCFTEVRDERTGSLRHVVDFKRLRQLLGDDTVEDERESYEFTWVGKQAARREAATSIHKTLRPVIESSVDWDNTRNIYIEGDNLDTLKLLQKSYLGKVKMIYIDPPYNTGNDFVYNDKFEESTESFNSKAGIIDSVGQKLINTSDLYFRNTESNGRFHSDWCSMIYPRLQLAHSLLKEDGAIFISIGDDEEANLIKICDEIFGELNFIASICHKHRASVSNDRIISENHNHLVFYAKDINVLFAHHKEIGEDPNLDGFKNRDERGEYKLTPVDGPGGAKKGNPHYEFLGVTGYWRYSKETMQEKYNNGLIVRTPNGLQQKYYKSQALQSRKTVTTWWDENFLTSTATKELESLMGGKYFDNPKNVNLLLRCLKMITHFDKDAIVMDFFSGSATTADAVMRINATDGGHRKFILVQLPEKVPENSEAFQAGYRNICQIGEERIRRSGKKIQNELKAKRQDLFENDNIFELDTGFRVFRVDSSNMKDVYFTPKDLKPEQLDLFADNVKENRSDLDLLYGSMLDWGVQLSLPLDIKTIDGVNVYTVNEGDLVACFNKPITDKIVKAIADKAPLRVLFRDSCFEKDEQKINIFEQFKQLLGWSDEEALNNIRVI